MSSDHNAIVMEYIGWHGPATLFRHPVLNVKDAANIDLGLIGVPSAGANPLARTFFYTASIAYEIITILADVLPRAK